jgi:hypothetical protein
VLTSSAHGAWAGGAAGASAGESPPAHAAGGVGWLLGSTPPPDGNGPCAGSPGRAGGSPGAGAAVVWPKARARH